MRYQQIQPPDYLQEYVRYFWIMENDRSGNTFKTIADGCPGLIFQNTENGAFFQNDKQLPSIFLYGQATTHAEISLGKSTAVGIYFYPNALKSIFGFNADELTDTCLDLDLIATSRDFLLSEQLLNSTSVTDQIETLSSYLFFQIKRNNTGADEITQYALSQIIESKGSISLKELQKKMQLSERSFERKFKQHIGVSPKLYSRICSFQASLSQLRNNKFDKLSDIAYENGYADQSHFIRNFKEFAGFSPYQYQKQPNELASNFPELIS